MPFDSFMFDDDDLSDGCNDCGDIGLPPPKVRSVCDNVGRSLDEILQLEYEIINENTEIHPELWIHLFAEKFRSIMDVDSSGTKSQIKRKLYLNE